MTILRKPEKHTIRTSRITLPFFQELTGVITTPLITPNHFLGLNKRNSQEKIHHLVLSLLGLRPCDPGTTPEFPDGP